MSTHTESLLKVNNIEDHEELIDDKKGQNCCFRIFKCRNSRKGSKNKTERYELKDKSILVDNAIDENDDDTNDLKDQSTLIESPVNENVDRNVKARRENPVERLHPGDKNPSCIVNANNKPSIQGHANEAEYKLDKPQDNSLNSLKDNNENNVEIPYVECKQTDVVNSSCENNLSGNVLTLDLVERKQSVPSSSSDNAVDNPKSEITVQSDLPIHVKDSKALTNNTPRLETKNNLFLTSGPEEFFESSDCEPDASSYGRNILLGNLIAAETKQSQGIRSSTTSEILEIKVLKNIGVDINIEDEVLEISDKKIVDDSTTCQAGGRKTSSENIVCTENVLVASGGPSAERENKIVVESLANVDSGSKEKFELAVGIPINGEENVCFNNGVDVNIDLRTSPEGSEGVSVEPSDLTGERKDLGIDVKSANCPEMTNYYSIVSDPLLYTQADLDEVVKAREDEWQQRQDELETKIKEEIAMRELLEEDHRSKMDSLKKGNSEMKTVVSQYENTIVELTEQSRNAPAIDEDTLSETVRVKEQLHQDLNTAEQNLVDAYKRIEKLKLAVDSYKQNEDSLKGSLKDYQTKLQKSEERYNKLKQHASDKIDAANIEIERVRKQKEIDLAGLQAALKKAQNRVSNLEVEISQKTHENRELSQICDELIKKVSGE